MEKLNKPSENAESDDSNSDDETYEDAKPLDNEKLIDELIEKHKDLAFGNCSDDDKEKSEKFTEILENSKDCEEKFSDCKTGDLIIENSKDFIDDEKQRETEKDLDENVLEENRQKSEELKNDGNSAFKNQDYEKSIELYTEGLRMCPVKCGPERSILYANRAAAKIKLECKMPAIDDCTKALEFNEKYTKALLRRAKLYEETDKLDESLDDYKKLLELEPDNIEARAALIRLPPIINERNEKLKTEMLGKLKDLGNMILKPFGLSTNNFQMQQDSGSGSYSINFKQ